MKTIGFVDYYISEWHANNYPAWIEAANRVLGTDYRVSYAWAERDVSPVDGVSTDEWCAKFGVTKCESIDELCQRADVIMILSPSDPDKHLGYARAVFPYGKRVYVDKTFAPDLRTAKEIFALADKYNTPFFSTSALRYASELADFADVRDLIVTGGGGSPEEYIIHQAEIAIKLTGIRPTSVTVVSQGKQRVFSAVGEDKMGETRKVTFVFAPPLPFSICAQDSAGKGKYAVIRSDFFAALLVNILKLYECGSAPFEGEETLDVMALRDALLGEMHDAEVAGK